LARIREVLSVCIVTGRRIPMLDACLRSLLEQDRPPPFELLVCSDGDAEVEAAVRRRFPDARVCAVDRALPGAARNLLVADARGELLVFLDDDVTVRDDLLRRLADLAATHPDVGVFGGPNDTPPGSSSFQLVQGAALASMLGSGPVRRRYGPHPAGSADQRSFILCNLAIRRSVMVPFSPALLCAEENDVLEELARRGVRMHYDPELVVFHERRATVRGFAQQMHKYGRGRGQLLVRRPSSTRASFLAPTALVAYGAASPALAVAVGPAAVAPLALYAAAVLASSAWVARTLRSPGAIPTAVVCFLVIHLCYGIGLARGLVGRHRPPPDPRVLSWAGPRGEASTDPTPAPPPRTDRVPPDRALPGSP
jgi:succinoglycan biosynthesis protein ExoA